MGVPNISERKHYRLVPGEPEEHTSTIVLTSKDSYFVDVRILRDKMKEEKGQEANTEGCLEWAFAGKSHSTFSKDSSMQLCHTVWDHWIDSRSNNAASDEGDMWLQPNGDILEKGKNNDPVTGEETEYEELWHDLQVEAFGKKHNRSSLVMRADEPERDIKGMAIKIGGWCEGILKIGDGLTIERWEWKPTDSASDIAPTEASKEEVRTRNDWIRTFKIGKATLPCKHICSRTYGKFGLNAVLKSTTDVDWKGLNAVLKSSADNEWKSDIEWKVVEEYYW